MSEPPSGSVTFLFTDIEGSTRLWQQSPEAMRIALTRHDALLRDVLGQHNGRVFKTIGDAFCAAFGSAGDACLAACAAISAIEREPWPASARIKVRIAVHTGAAEVRDDDYFGPTLSRVARLLGAAYGGQILLSQAAAALVRDNLPDGVELRDMGERRLKDLVRAERVYQLIVAGLPADFPPLKTLDARGHNLPIQLTSFVGREQEIREVKAALRSSRLVTFTGPGGAGKTRLALQAAADSIDDYADGVWFVELAPLTDASFVPQAIARVLGVKEEPGTPLTETLLQSSKSKLLLLILDNCEHLVDGTAVLCERLLTSCADVRVLTTTREALRIPGEKTYRVRSLATLDPSAARAATLAQYPAAQLFIDRATAAQPAFAAKDDNASAIGSICHRLDGIPLAIELAAARVRSMSVEEVNRRLDHRFNLLTQGSRTALPRQQTLRALIDWSHDLLNEAEQRLLERLAVFAGGWTLSAAETVCAGEPVDEWQVLDVLSSLADKSLIICEERAGETRYRLLETMREYSLDRIQDRGEEGRWRARHLAHHVALAEEAESRFAGPEQRLWLERLETEHDNLRAALTWSMTPGGDPTSGLRLGGSLFRFWSIRGYITEGRSWLSSLLAAVPDGKTSAHARALSGAGAMAWQQGDYAAARNHHEACLAIRREIGDRSGVAASLSNLGILAYDQGMHREARELLTDALAIQRELGNKRGIANTLNNLGIIASEEGDYAGARVLHEECLAIHRSLGDRRGIAVSLTNVGAIAHEQSEYPSARALHEQSLAIFRELGDRRGAADALNSLGDVTLEQGDHRSASAFQRESLETRRDMGDRRGIATSLVGLADIEAAVGHPQRAATIWGAAERLREEIGSPMRPSEQAGYDRRVTVARSALADDVAFTQAWDEGRAMTLENAIEYALSDR